MWTTVELLYLPLFFTSSFYIIIKRLLSPDRHFAHRIPDNCPSAYVWFFQILFQTADSYGTALQSVLFSLHIPVTFSWYTPPFFQILQHHLLTVSYHFLFFWYFFVICYFSDTGSVIWLPLIWSDVGVTASLYQSISECWQLLRKLTSRFRSIFDARP